MAKVSIVVPIYKAERYLMRCIKSILVQTLKDVEIILVDDGSPDNCPQICDSYALRDDRIKVVHKENGGLSSARNAGMDAATGDYIGFVDADDCIMPEMYMRMAEVIQEYHVDFVMSDYIRINSDGRSYIKTLKIRDGLYKKEDIKQDIFPSLIMGDNLDYGPLLSVCHCMYNLCFLREREIRFDEDVRWSEDNIFSALMGYEANSFYYIKGEGLYCYYQNEGTITTSYRPDAWAVYKTMNSHLQDRFAETKDFDFTQQLKRHLVYYACNCTGQVLHLPKSNWNEYLRKLLSDPDLESAFYGLRVPGAPIKLKLQLWLMKHKRIKLLEKILERRASHA